MILPKLTRKYLWFFSLAVLLVFGSLVWLVLYFFSPAPPRSIDMSTGASDGAYHQFGLQYQTYLKANGVKLNLNHSTGSPQNIERLKSGTSVALVQGGLGTLQIDSETLASDTGLRALGVVAYEPAWVFTREKLAGPGLESLKSKKIAVGALGSGTYKVAIDLLKAYELDEKNTQVRAVSGLEAANQLAAGQLDALIIVAAIQSPTVQQLLSQKNVQLVSIAHAEGLARRLPYLSTISLKAGSVDPQRNLPAQDVTLLSTTANLVVRDDLHPALAYLLLEAAFATHKKPSLLNSPQEFPHPRSTDFPLSDEAQRYYKEGRPFLQRYLPFWLANFVQRMLVILIPLLAIAIPALKTIPDIIDWFEKSRLFHRYDDLRKIEKSIQSGQMSREDIDKATHKLDVIEKEIADQKFALDFSDRVYTLRQHVDYARASLKKELETAQR
jgi:TRAP transporter TAXI family solute receptor